MSFAVVLAPPVAARRGAGRQRAAVGCDQTVPGGRLGRGMADPEHRSTEDLFDEMFRDVAARAFEGRTADEIAAVVASGHLDEAINETIPRVASTLADSLVASAPPMLADRAGALAVTADEVRRTYGPGLDLCEMVLRVASETGEEYAARHLESDGGPALQWVLAHLQARACRIAEEALTLLKAGYGPGASSRWRSLYEIAVVATFIGKHGDETAVRYVDHLWVQRWRVLKDADESGTLDQAGQAALQDAKAEVDRLVTIHGDGFNHEYGWAANALPAAAHHGFRALADATDFAHVRADYRQASATVHANASGVLEPPDADHMESTLVTGPSLVAIEGPAYGVATTLAAVTGALMVSADYVSTAYVISTMLELCDRAKAQLSDAAERVEAAGE